ncbi:Mitoguardin, partial [Frankliniella fusca]
MAGSDQIGPMVTGMKTLLPASALFGRMSTQKIVILSVTAGVAVLGILARYLRRRRRTVKPDFFRKYPRRFTKSTAYSIKSPNGDVLSQASGSTAAGGQGSRLSRRGSVLSMHTMSTDRLSLPSSSVVGGAQGDARAPLAPQELGSL